MNIAILGMGYVGLTTAVCLAKKNHSVFCVDKDAQKLERISRGDIPFFEPGLEDLFNKNKERLFLISDIKMAVGRADVIFIAVETPFEEGRLNHSSVEKAAVEIGKALQGCKNFPVIVVKSTALPGTTEQVVVPAVLKYSGKNETEIGFCMNPEFMREGSAIEDLEYPDRIVLGVSSEIVASIMKRVYADFGDTDFLVTNPTTAEMIKYTCNSYFALTISYANEISRICEKLPLVDSENVFRGLLLDRRISPKQNNERIFPEWSSYLKAGCGFGGSCFPKDVKALALFEEKLGLESGLLHSLLVINQKQTEHVFNLGFGNHEGPVKSIAVLGTAFKPETDDIRESPGIKFCIIGLAHQLNVAVHDYRALSKTRSILGNSVRYCDSAIDAIRNADVIFMATAWKGYQDLTDRDFEMHMKENAMLVDCRSIYKNRDHKSWRKQVGFGSVSHHHEKLEQV